MLSHGLRGLEERVSQELAQDLSFIIQKNAYISVRTASSCTAFCTAVLLVLL